MSLRKNEPIDIVMLNMSADFEWHGSSVSWLRRFVRWQPALAKKFYAGVFNRNLAILEALSKDKRVRQILSVDFVPQTVKRKLKEYILAGLWQGGRNVAVRGLTYKVTRQSVSSKVYTFSGLTLDHVPEIMKKLQFHNVVLWSYNPLEVDCFRSIPHDVAVFDAVDDWSHHPEYVVIRDRIRQNYRTIATHARAIFTVAKDLHSLFPGHASVHWISNGVDSDHYAAQRPRPAEFSDIMQPIIGYHGIIQSRLDVELLEDVVAAHPEWAFVFVGLVWPGAGAAKLQKYPNVRFLGQKTYAELPAYIQHFDVGILPHRVDAFTKTMNPMKIYEYLACGKPVVSTPVAGVDLFPEYIQVALTAEEFSFHIKRVLEMNSEAQGGARQQAVAPHTWTRRVHAMLDILLA
ncbi:MAG: hypothetical protein A3F54_01460 [Candidatus Kerfeldbacteria bacterium RIFCSPHIGHO2_12_FULL_48_17]|uniref:Spore protein YkvP/CgeB glycosyl transferase-like domain-containing protein n=1 Tax=Candidatus Kerfeldbacteria bacterium RIFCSPHIGHO2_12_FULL_48_17 TaxID=1798542 RepID=A0A1G2AXN9_9BACT|nr:MAG: hypothetical protein A3F54_01460 [Candidatus Kerfeldbacteria bacterium RIFCSPHIGHO2_12_FULL_48_17]